MLIAPLAHSLPMKTSSLHSRSELEWDARWDAARFTNCLRKTIRSSSLPGWILFLNGDKHHEYIHCSTLSTTTRGGRNNCFSILLAVKLRATERLITYLSHPTSTSLTTVLTCNFQYGNYSVCWCCCQMFIWVYLSQTEDIYPEASAQQTELFSTQPGSAKLDMNKGWINTRNVKINVSWAQVKQRIPLERREESKKKWLKDCLSFKNSMYFHDHATLNKPDHIWSEKLSRGRPG